MIQIAQAHATTTATPERIFAIWADMTQWPEWNSDTEWVRLDGSFVQGARGRLKPAGAPSVAFVVERLEHGSVFVDASRLVGARLVFDHRVNAVVDQPGAVRITVSITMDG